MYGYVLSSPWLSHISAVMDEIQHRENDEEELTIDPEREAYYKDDPKKALKKFFDREGTVRVHIQTC